MAKKQDFEDLIVESHAPRLNTPKLPGSLINVQISRQFGNDKLVGQFINIGKMANETAMQSQQKFNKIL